jgi:hypothetical protein
MKVNLGIFKFEFIKITLFAAWKPKPAMLLFAAIGAAKVAVVVLALIGFEMATDG